MACRDAYHLQSESSSNIPISLSKVEDPWTLGFKGGSKMCILLWLVSFGAAMRDLSADDLISQI